MPIEAQFPQPLECLFQPKRYKVLYGGRGAGRSWGVARALLLLGQLKPIRVLCVRELQNSMESVHKVLTDQIEQLGLGNFYTIEKSKLYGSNGTTFSFDGIRNNVNKIKSYEGIDYCWVEEANKVTKNSWSVLVPTIRKEASEIWITFNPELETDHTYVRFVKEAVAADSYVVKMTWRDNPWFPQVLKKEMEADKERDFDHYLNIWEGHTVQQLEGAVYAKELRRATLEKRILTVPYDRSLPVDVYWDLGRADNTAAWFVQRVAMQWRILAYYEATGQDITHFFRELQKRAYVYGTMNLPHDAKAKRLGSKLTIEELFKQAGYRTNIVPSISIIDGINAARIIMSNCYWDANGCEDGLNALRHYRFKVIDGHLSEKPLHDWASDGADAWRYFAICAKDPTRPRSNIVERLKLKLALGDRPGLGWMA